MINSDTIKSERSLRDMIDRNIKKEIHAGTKPSMDFIKKILDDSYDAGLTYDDRISSRSSFPSPPTAVIRLCTASSS